MPPVRVDEHATNRGRDGTQHWRGNDRELQEVHKLDDPDSTMSKHRVSVVGVTIDVDVVVDWWLSA
jgi:hypothetical protein